MQHNNTSGSFSLHIKRIVHQKTDDLADCHHLTDRNVADPPDDLQCIILCCFKVHNIGTNSVIRQYFRFFFFFKWSFIGIGWYCTVCMPSLFL